MSAALEARRQAQIDLFEAAKAGKLDECEAAIKAGADLNFNKHNGGSLLAWKGWRLKMGGIEWGLQEWDAPSDVKPETGDTLLMIALKCDREALVRWIIARPEYKSGTANNAGKSAAEIAKDRGHAAWLIAGSSDIEPTPPVSAESSPKMQAARAPPAAAAAAAVAALVQPVLRDGVDRCWTEVISPGETVRITTSTSGWLPRRLRDEQLLAANGPGAEGVAAATAAAAQQQNSPKGHTRTMSEGTPPAAEAKHLRVTIACRDREIAELKEALKAAKAAKEQSDEAVAALTTRVRILESSVKSTKPLWLK